MLRYILTLLLLCCLPLLSQAQNLEQNLNKYWQYRDKLRTQFMLIGDAQGYSEPASYINPGFERMKWSDNTIWLGWYLGTLATEYDLLHNSYYTGYADDSTGIRIQKNRTELYYALKALIRLDANAETYFPSPCDSLPNQRNGFFLRDDVDSSITDSFPGYNFVDSDYEEHSFANEMSQDQVYHVLLGLSLIKKFIPDTVVINGMHIKAEAVNQASLIGAWVHQDNWIIKNPACSNKDVDRGPDASLLSKGLNLALIYITDGASDYTSDVNGIADFTWSTLTNPAVFVNVDNLHMTLALAAMGEGWGSTTLDKMMVLVESNKWYAYPLLYIALRDTNSVSNYAANKPTMMFWSDSMLNEAPIGGPLTTYPDSNGNGYGVNNRFIRPRSQHYVSTNPGEAGHQWNGLDYMLLHNLRLIVEPGVWKSDTANAIQQVVVPEFQLYPNPATDQLLVQLLAGVSTAEAIEVYDLTGRLQLEQPINGQQNIKLDISRFPAGLYLVKVGAGFRRLMVQ